MFQYEDNGNQGEAQAWWDSTHDDKGHAPEQQKIAQSIEFLESRGYKVIPPSRYFSDEIADEVKKIMKDAAKELDNDSDSFSRTRTYRKDSEQIAKGLIILVLKNENFYDDQGTPMTPTAFCKKLSSREDPWNRNIIPKLFQDTRDVKEYAHSQKFTNDDINNAYARIKKNIMVL